MTIYVGCDESYYEEEIEKEKDENDEWLDEDKARRSREYQLENKKGDVYG